MQLSDINTFLCLQLEATKAHDYLKNGAITNEIYKDH